MQSTREVTLPVMEVAALKCPVGQLTKLENKTNQKVGPFLISYMHITQCVLLEYATQKVNTYTHQKHHIQYMYPMYYTHNMLKYHTDYIANTPTTCTTLPHTYTNYIKPQTAFRHHSTHKNTQHRHTHKP